MSWRRSRLAKHTYQICMPRRCAERVSSDSSGRCDSRRGSSGRLPPSVPDVSMAAGSPRCIHDHEPCGRRSKVNPRLNRKIVFADCKRRGAWSLPETRLLKAPSIDPSTGKFKELCLQCRTIRESLTVSPTFATLAGRLIRLTFSLPSSKLSPQVMFRHRCFDGQPPHSCTRGCGGTRGLNCARWGSADRAKLCRPGHGGAGSSLIGHAFPQSAPRLVAEQGARRYQQQPPGGGV